MTYISYSSLLNCYQRTFSGRKGSTPGERNNPENSFIFKCEKSNIQAISNPRRLLQPRDRISFGFLVLKPESRFNKFIYDITGSTVSSGRQNFPNFVLSYFSCPPRGDIEGLPIFPIPPSPFHSLFTPFRSLSNSLPSTFLQPNFLSSLMESVV